MATLNDRLKRLEHAASVPTIALDQVEAGPISERLIRRRVQRPEEDQS